jgi:hypothetical protein
MKIIFEISINPENSQAYKVYPYNKLGAAQAEGFKLCWADVIG